MKIPAFIIGNGLSIALSKDFSLQTITKDFINSMEGKDKLFLQELSSFNGSVLDFDNFEANFTTLESSLDSVIKYNAFINSSVGKTFCKRYKLSDPKLEKHIETIQRIYRTYITKILTIIQGNVHHDAINRKLKGFVDFLISKVESSNHLYIFSLNYDLLIEAILLQYVGTNFFTDFCFPSHMLAGTTIEKYDFNPQRSIEWFKSPDRKTELHHLHGSLSLFYDYSRNRAIKLKSDDISWTDIYQKIADESLPLMPAIITGGGKSDKIIQYPFDYYYRSVKDICDSGKASEMYIIGYSFRDEHINDLISRWMREVEDYTKGLRIVDFKKTEDEKQVFMGFVRSKISKRPKIPDHCFIFEGVNFIIESEGTRPKPENKK